MVHRTQMEVLIRIADRGFHGSWQKPALYGIIHRQACAVYAFELLVKFQLH